MAEDTRSQFLELAKATDRIDPFRVHVPQAVIDDLRRRLMVTRWPDKETADSWEQGVPLARAREIVNKWRTTYDWRLFEKKINAFPQFRTLIDGIGIHFIHVKSKHENALPIILTHGWPGSIVEFLGCIDPLVNPEAHGGKPEDAFHVVLPSLPGYGFSDKPVEKGWNWKRTAKAWGVLMQRLGYDRWVAQGGDWGAAVTLGLAQQRPLGLVAAHVNWLLVVPDHISTRPSTEEIAIFKDLANFAAEGNGYFKEHATRPQTLGYGLADSPVAQAMWIYEKLPEWSQHRGESDVLSRTEMLDDISLYWFTNSGTSSGRFYWENFHSYPPFSTNLGRVDLPMAATVYPGEGSRALKEWAQAQWPNLYYWGSVAKGGHFAAWEQPEIFVNDIRNAFSRQRV
ncbi:epoxide hydrolase [Gluconacetobacter entanii]|uniref:epoxide hydrolase family protein n=1 Tax=Gluconacetobacter entanii TaxID=108528 RepID=UPI001C93585E|nr:epoxide hydrolase family protein [Gluconacetobacter entanii]MBY4640514.1 epoxide hydrolase [Gluconacetobacter entanii]MCW4579113.1 epoxide hydrolase [Gluconacetobacter entanii]MCW4582514.1 epoxide hydrolase [Gluconacetobacter entanii]MCW4585887.1 epoxide hydrolase [Gluconacetobacter entanii]